MFGACPHAMRTGAKHRACPIDQTITLSVKKSWLCLRKKLDVEVLVMILKNRIK
jgi:hypothetical protein